MIEISIDGKKHKVAEGLTILQACEQAGVEIPRFCYHEKLEIAGNCRMCLVEVEGARKPVASCAEAVRPDMIVRTKTESVEKARKGVMEFLLINHPLDCPICDQGGECDLQEQALHYGKAENRFDECKRSVDGKNFGPLVKTFMNRCIHCTRCVRFIEDIAGTNELGAVNRGEGMEITTSIEGVISSELSGNIIDLCPVGALTSNPFAYKARSWELKNTDAIDIFDALGSNIVLQAKGREVMRVLPRVNEAINEEWISDKVRFCYDGLKYNRLDRHYRMSNGNLTECSEVEAFNILENRLNKADKSKILAKFGKLTDLETTVSAMSFMNAIGAKNASESRVGDVLLTHEDKGFYKLNSTIAGIEEADYILIIGANTKVDAPILNARIRKAVTKRGAKAAVIGQEIDLNFPYKHLSANPWSIKQFNNKEFAFAKDFAKAKRPLVLVGISAFTETEAEAFKYYLRQMIAKFNLLRDEWNGFNVLPLYASTVGGLELGATVENFAQKINNAEVLFLFGADDIDISKIPSNTFVVYVGHHGDNAVKRADLIIPCAAFSEKNSTFVNAEGRVQRSQQAVNAPTTLAKVEWQILADFASHIGVEYNLNSYDALYSELLKRLPIAKNLGVPHPDKVKLDKTKLKDFSVDNFEYPIDNFYMTDSISRSSKTMQECTKRLLNVDKNAA